MVLRMLWSCLGLILGALRGSLGGPFVGVLEALFGLPWGPFKLPWGLIWYVKSLTPIGGELFGSATISHRVWVHFEKAT